MAKTVKARSDKKTLPAPIRVWHDYIDRKPERHCADIRKLKAVIEGLLERKDITYDKEPVDRFIAFCRTLKHREGRWAGRPFEPSKEQKYFAACVFGLKIQDAELGQEVRYFREAILWVARKFGKSAFISAIAAYMLISDGEAAPQVWTLATQKTQASIVYKNARDMLLTSDVLTPRKNPSRIWHTKRDTDNCEMIQCPLNGGYMKAGSKNSKGQDGLNPSCFIIDELHAITDRNTYDVFSSAQGARSQPLSVIISTFGFVREGIFDSMYERCRKALDGKTENARIFPMIFRIDDDDNPDDRSCWIKANPGIPEARPTMAYLEGEYQKAKDDPAQMPSFLAKHLNRAVNAASIYFDLQDIDGCAADLLESDFFDKYAVGGVDLAETTDLCCATMLVPEGGKLKVFQRYFIAEARMEQNSKQDKMAYGSFTLTGAEDPLNKELLTICPGPMVRKEDVSGWFIETMVKYKINYLAMGYDDWHSKDFLSDMEQHGFTKVDKDGYGVMFPVGMGSKSLSAPMKELRALITDKVFQFSRFNGLLRWCMSNVAVTVDANNSIRPEKVVGNKRIDGFMSLLLAYIAYKLRQDMFEKYQP